MFPSLTDNFPIQFVVCQEWETMWDHGCHAVCYVSHTVCQSECQTQCASQYVTHSVSFSVSVSTLIDIDWECSHTMLQSNFRVFVQCGHHIATLGSNLGISTLLEILQSCKLDHKVAWFCTWLPPNHRAISPPPYQKFSARFHLNTTARMTLEQ